MRQSLFVPNGFVTVMGTGIVAVTAAGLPIQLPGQRMFALLIWLLAALLLVMLGTGGAARWIRHPADRPATLAEPARYFFGAPPMAMLTVGAGALLVGADLVGRRAALLLDIALWIPGTTLGVSVAVAALLRWLRRPASRAGGPGPLWLLPVVPPLVSASTGALLLPELPAGLRAVWWWTCGALAFASICFSAAISLALVCRVGRGLAVLPIAAPALFIVLGPIGQFITAINLLERGAVLVPGLTLPGSVPALVGAVSVGGLVAAAAWIGVASRQVLRAVRSSEGLPFSLAWWSFTFPVGTLVTGTGALAARTDQAGAATLSAGLFVVLVTAWIVVAVRTLSAALLPWGHGSIGPAPAGRPTTRRDDHPRWHSMRSPM